MDSIPMEAPSGSSNNNIFSKIIENVLRKDNHANKDYSGVVFGEISREEINFRGANLSLSSFISANLPKARLKNSILKGANLSKSNLCKSDLKNANLESANLQNADLYHSDLRGANLEGANLKGAKLEMVCVDDKNWLDKLQELGVEGATELSQKYRMGTTSLIDKKGREFFLVLKK